MSSNIVIKYSLGDDIRRATVPAGELSFHGVFGKIAEAFAEVVHTKIRTEYWGYAPDEALSADDLLKVKYDGIRPAPGYPSQPDHTEKNTMWDLMKVAEQSDVTLTESLAMLPDDAICSS